jgi:rhodanese-related sulfurtransferase
MNTMQEFVKLYYSLENAVSVSPHGLRVRMDKGAADFILIDVRSPHEFEEAHIKGAYNIPVYKDPTTPVYGEKERIVNEFKKLPTDKELIVYCYSKACMSGKKVGKMLSEEGIYVKHLGIGWNEWRHKWNDWNHEHEWNKKKVEDYIQTGKSEKQLPDQQCAC